MKKEISKEFEAGERSMARAVLRRIYGGLGIGHIKLLCEAIANEEEWTKKESPLEETRLTNKL